jgi:hypothetical protein
MLWLTLRHASPCAGSVYLRSLVDSPCCRAHWCYGTGLRGVCCESQLMCSLPYHDRGGGTGSLPQGFLARTSLVESMALMAPPVQEAGL